VRLLEGESWKRRFQSFKTSVFRLETLPVYKVANEEVEEFQRFLAGEKPPADLHYAWLDTISRGVELGKVFQRVHLVRSPLTDYIRYEFEWAYAFNVRAGEDIRILDLTEIENPGLPAKYDYWIFDESEIVHMRYEEDGTQIDRALLDNPDFGQHLRWRDLALEYAVPFAEYHAKHP
jgi:hypothetical protein